MNQIAGWIIFALMAVLGGGASLFLVVSLPGIILWKIYRMIRYGYKLTD